MTIAETVKAVLNDEYHKRGMKQREIAKAHNVSRSYIQSLLTGRCPFEGITLDSLSKMFPLATLNLNGNITTSQQGTNNVVVNGENSGTVNNGSHATAQSSSAEQARSRIIAALIPLDIPPESLQTVLRTINELELN